MRPGASPSPTSWPDYLSDDALDVADSRGHQTANDPVSRRPCPDFHLKPVDYPSYLRIASCDNTFVKTKGGMFRDSSDRLVRRHAPERLRRGVPAGAVDGSAEDPAEERVRVLVQGPQERSFVPQERLRTGE